MKKGNGVKVAVVYTGTTPELIELVEEDIRKKLGHGVEILTLKNPDILKQVKEAGHVTAQAAADLILLYMQAVKQGADAVLNVCSSVGEVADSMRQAADYMGIPIVRMDADMCREAVETGRKIAVVATLATTMEPTQRAVRNAAAKTGRQAELIPCLVDGAFGSEQEEFRKKMIEKAYEVRESADVILLAQGSMAYVERDMREASGLPVLSSPRFGAARLRRVLAEKGYFLEESNDSI